MNIAYKEESVAIYQGNALEVLRELPDGLARCCVTSPPYWGLRDYGIPQSIWPDGWVGCHGLEPTVDLYVRHAVEIFRELRRTLADDGTLWLNLGDTYIGSWGGYRIDSEGGQRLKTKEVFDRRYFINNKDHPRPPSSMKQPDGLKNKDLAGVPWRVALALQADGWYLRCDIIWHKPNPMPESVTDRPTKAHEYIFLLSKSEKYYYDQKAIREPVTGNAHGRGNGVNPKAKKVPYGWDTGEGNHKQLTGRYKSKQNESFSSACCDLVEDRNKRSVWTVPTCGYSDAHFATFPPNLIKPCILAGSQSGDTVIDLFMGSGTVAYVSKQLGRKAVGIEIDSKDIRLIKNRLIQEVLPI